MATVLSAQENTLVFPAFRLGVNQGLNVKVIALGGRQDRCRAVLSIKDVNGETLGAGRAVDQGIGVVGNLLYYSASPVQVRPVVELTDSPSSCFASIDALSLEQILLAGVRRPLSHPADHGFASYITVGQGESLELSVSRPEGVPGACSVRAQFSDEAGAPLTPATTMEPAVGKALFLEVPSERIGVGVEPGSMKRVVFDVSAVSPNSAEGCVAATTLVNKLGHSIRIVPVPAVRRLPEGRPLLPRARAPPHTEREQDHRLQSEFRSACARRSAFRRLTFRRIMP